MLFSIYYSCTNVCTFSLCSSVNNTKVSLYRDWIKKDKKVKLEELGHYFLLGSRAVVSWCPLIWCDVMLWPCRSNDSHTLLLNKQPDTCEHGCTHVQSLEQPEAWRWRGAPKPFPQSNLNWTFVYWLWLANTSQVWGDRWWLNGVIAHITREIYFKGSVPSGFCQMSTTHHTGWMSWIV